MTNFAGASRVFSNPSIVASARLDPYYELANAIVLQACRDYRDLWGVELKHSVQKRKILKFFRSRWFSILTNVNPEWLIQKLDEEEREKRKLYRWTPETQNKGKRLKLT